MPPQPHRIIFKQTNPTNCLIKLPNDSSTFTWNSLLRSSPPHRAPILYTNMLESNSLPNKFTFTFLLKSCNKISNPHFTTHLHSHLIKFGFGSDAFLQSSLIGIYANGGSIRTAQQVFDNMSYRDVVSWTALVSAYAKCGMPDEAFRVFDKMPERNAVSWAAVVTGYSQSGRHEEALMVFENMRSEDVGMTEGTVISVLCSAAQVGGLEVGKWVHEYVKRNGMVLSVSIGTALLSMYSKCGCIDDAIRVFGEMPRRDGFSWTAMISALSMHGKGEQAFALFDEMVILGLRPDGVTFMEVLSACSHSGFIEEGRYYFRCMEKVYNIVPGLEHYGCLVDILGRGGHVEEAWDLVRNMPMKPNALMLKSLLSACASHCNLDCAEWTAEKLVELDQDTGSPYILLGNVYASVGRWEDAERVRKIMRVRKAAKTPGCSSVEVDGRVYKFEVGYIKEQHNAEDLKSVLHGISKISRLANP